MVKENSPAFRAATLGAVLAKALPEVSAHRIAVFVNGAQRLTKQAVAHSERMCSFAEYANKHQDAETGEDLKAEKLQAKADALVVKLLEGTETALVGENAPMLPVTLEVGGDPRGACGFIHINGVRGDGFGSGFAVY